MLIKEKLILDNINLIYMVLKRYNLYNQLDEYYDIGMIGLVKGANSFSEDKGYKVSTYLTSCITYEILNYKIQLIYLLLLFHFLLIYNFDIVFLLYLIILLYLGF